MAGQAVDQAAFLPLVVRIAHCCVQPFNICIKHAFSCLCAARCHRHEQAMEFAQSKGNARRDGSTGVTFADVGGLGNTISEMMQVVEVRRCCVGVACGVPAGLQAARVHCSAGSATALPLRSNTPNSDHSQLTTTLARLISPLLPLRILPLPFH